jgi:hypothetical protein
MKNEIRPTGCVSEMGPFSDTAKIVQVGLLRYKVSEQNSGPANTEPFKSNPNQCIIIAGLLALNESEYPSMAATGYCHGCGRNVTYNISETD